MPNQTITLEGRIEPEKEKSYINLPFLMPEGATHLEVHYDYTNAISADPAFTGGTTIDLGVFDARGIDFSSAGFRGWSGSERSSFYITEREATPGYLAGQLIPGYWHVLLGLYKVAPQGSSYRVDITITTEPNYKSLVNLPSPVSQLPVSHPNPWEEGWLRGELHCHSWHSDGDTAPEELVKLARSRGLDFLAVTDHNTTSSQQVLAQLDDPGIILLLGIEVTTFKGHFNVWGTGDWIDFRVQDQEQMAASLRLAGSKGAITSCNHPKPSGPPWEYESVANYQCIEVWNGPWRTNNQIALDFWLSQLAAGSRVPAVGGSDYHRRSQLDQGARAPGLPTTWVYIHETATASSILEAIRQGHVSLSANPDGPFLELRAGTELSSWQGDALRRAIDQPLQVQIRCKRGAGNWLRLYDQRRMLWEGDVTQEDEIVRLRLSVGESEYVRAELRDVDDEMKALTNPIYFDR